MLMSRRELLWAAGGLGGDGRGHQSHAAAGTERDVFRDADKAQQQPPRGTLLGGVQRINEGIGASV